MQIIRREFLALSGLALAAPSIATMAQAQAGPKLTQILRKDLEGQGDVVQETVVSIVEFPPGAAAPWHMHPGAQELLHVIEGKGSTLLKGWRGRNHSRGTRPPRPQRERQRERQGAGRPQPGCKGQTADRGREEIAAGVAARSRSRGEAATRVTLNSARTA